MRLKRYDEFTNEEIGWKNALLGAAIGLSPISTQKAKSQTPQTQQQTQKVLATVSMSRSEPISNPNYDDIHGALGSKKSYMKDNFENRVSNELTKQFNAGKKPDVSNIKVRTYVKGNQIVTEASCDIIESSDGNAYTHFTTRGSIGDDYDVRHDNQVKGLVGRLEQLYGGKAKQVGKTFDIEFNDANGDVVKYRQSFFVSSDSSKVVNKIVAHTYSIKANNSDDLRMKLKNETKGLSIDVNSISIDMKTLEVKFKAGPTKIMNLSLITDNQGVISSRLKDIKSKNPTMTVIDQGNANGLDWALLLF